MFKNITFKLKLKEGYLLKIISDTQFEVHHVNGNGYLKFNSREALLNYVIQINSDFEMNDCDGNVLG